MTLWETLYLAAIAQIIAVALSSSLIRFMQCDILLTQIKQDRYGIAAYNEILAGYACQRHIKALYLVAHWYRYPLYGLYRWYCKARTREINKAIDEMEARYAAKGDNA